MSFSFINDPCQVSAEDQQRGDGDIPRPRFVSQDAEHAERYDCDYREQEAVRDLSNPHVACFEVLVPCDVFFLFRTRIRCHGHFSKFQEK